MAPNDSPPPSFSPMRRLGIGLSVLLSVVAAVCLVLMVNYLAARHFTRYQWTSDARYELSAPTKRVLEAVTNEVKVTILFDRTEPVFALIAGLLKEYSYACPKVRVETVDYKSDRGRGELVIAKYHLPQSDVDQVIFDGNGRTKVVRENELSDYDWQGLLAGGKDVKRTAFKGEALFTSAIAGLLEARPPTAYLLQGHGEHSPSDDDAKSGYSVFSRFLEQKNITVKTLRLQGGGDIPEDCQLLVVAGPQDALDRTELEKVGKYLNQGGRMFGLLSYYRSQRRPTGMEKLMSEWGVVLGGDSVLDLPNSLLRYDLMCTNYSAHPIVKPLQTRALYLVVPRSVWPLQGAASSADAPRVQQLFATGPAGYTASALADDGTPRVNPARDHQGAIPLAVAVEKGSIQGVSADRGSTRIVVVGESIFLANETIVKAANIEFASLAINWLLDRPQHLGGIAPTPIKEYRILLTHSQMAQVRWVLLGAFPGAVLVVGFLVWMRRRA